MVKDRPGSQNRSVKVGKQRHGETFHGQREQELVGQSTDPRS